MRGALHGLMAATMAAWVVLGPGTARAAEPESISQDPSQELVVERPQSYENGSRVLVQELYSPALGQSMSYRVMLPPGYADSDERYPVLYMLHGVAGDSTEWEEIGLLFEADRMIANGDIGPLIVVLPYGGASYWVNHAGDGPRWSDYVSEDIVGNVDQVYRTIANRTGRAIGGLSMGGEGALRLAFRHPDLFIAVGGHSPSLRTGFDQLEPGAQAYYGDEERWRANSPYWLVEDDESVELLSILLDVGTDDPWRPNVEALHSRLTDRYIGHTIMVLEGEHDGSYWIANTSLYLGFYDSAFNPGLTRSSR